MQFTKPDDNKGGVIRAKGSGAGLSLHVVRNVPTDHMILRGGRPEMKHGPVGLHGDIVVWPCYPQDHELFVPTDRNTIELLMLAVHKKQHFCLNVAGGLGLGHPIVVFRCGAGGDNVNPITPNEEMVMGEDGRIRIHTARHLCVTAEGGRLESGTRLVLTHCVEEDAQATHQIFVIDNDVIRVKARPELNFNVEGNRIYDYMDWPGLSKPVVLWSCEDAFDALFIFNFRGQLQVRYRPLECLIATKGLRDGSQIRARNCSHEATPPAEERFAYDEDRQVIYASAAPHLIFSARNVSKGSVIQLLDTGGPREQEL